MSVSRFRAKDGGVVVEAMQLTTETGREVWEWADSKQFYEPTWVPSGLTIFTPLGRMKVDFGYWITRDTKGDFYPCAPDVFAATYEAVQ